MLKKTITYENPFTSQEVSEDHYFHISKADLVEMEMEEHNDKHTDKNGEELTGMQAKLTRIVESEDGKAIITEFKDIIRRSYGKKDGDRFLKSKEIWENFAATEAFSQLLFELCTQADASAEFINAVIPGNLEQIVAEVRAQAEKTTYPGEGDDRRRVETVAPALTTVEEVNGQPLGDEPKVLTTAEAAEMDSDELQSGLATGRYKLS